MATFICCEIVSAFPMSEANYIKDILKQKELLNTYTSNEDGYCVYYQDNQTTWIEKNMFETFFRPLTNSEINLVKND